MVDAGPGRFVKTLCSLWLWTPRRAKTPVSPIIDTDDGVSRRTDYGRYKGTARHQWSERNWLQDHQIQVFGIVRIMWLIFVIVCTYIIHTYMSPPCAWNVTPPRISSTRAHYFVDAISSSGVGHINSRRSMCVWRGVSHTLALYEVKDLKTEAWIWDSTRA